jgi:hypothetical protein
MGLAEIQKTLAQLYTNGDLRNQFFSDPTTIGKELGLDPNDIEHLAKLSNAHVKLFANSLQKKRLNEVRKLLPLTSQALGKRFNDLFAQYFESYNPIGVKKHLYDAINFSSFIKASIHEPIWLQDLVKYEWAWLQIAGSMRKLLVCQFKYNMRDLINSLRLDAMNPVLIKQSTFVVFVNIRGRIWIRSIKMRGKIYKDPN